MACRGAASAGGLGRRTLWAHCVFPFMDDAIDTEIGTLLTRRPDSILTSYHDLVTTPQPCFIRSELS